MNVTACRFLRLMHHPKLYSWVHKKHHEWHAPVAISVIYTTKTENLLITGGTGLVIPPQSRYLEVIALFSIQW
jgi:sterol desaturase/sphingolipid hydroxylase (fatty acid hydroxylase superfamily)